MRLPAFAAFALFVAVNSAAATTNDDGWKSMAGPTYAVGMGTVAGMTAGQALYIKGTSSAGRGRFLIGTLERRLPLNALRGRRLHLSLRLKNDGIATTAVTLQINSVGGSAFRSPAVTKWKTDDGEAWRVQQFVLDVPNDAQELVLDVSVKDNGMVWLDELKMEAVSLDMQVSSSRRIYSRRGDEGPTPYGEGMQPSILAPDPAAYAPLINGSFTVGGTPVTLPGSQPRP